MSRISIDKEYGVKLMPPDEEGNQSRGLRVFVEENVYNVFVMHNRSISPLFPTMGNKGSLMFLTPEEKEEVLHYVDETNPTNHAVYQYHLDMQEKISEARSDEEVKKLVNYKFIDEIAWNDNTYQAVVELFGDKLYVEAKINSKGKAELKAFAILDSLDEEEEMEEVVDDEPFELLDKIAIMIINDIKPSILNHLMDTSEKSDRSHVVL